MATLIINQQLKIRVGNTIYLRLLLCVTLLFFASRKQFCVHVTLLSATPEKFVGVFVRRCKVIRFLCQLKDNSIEKMYSGEDFGNSVSACKSNPAVQTALGQFHCRFGFAKHNPTFGCPHHRQQCKIYTLFTVFTLF